MSLMKRFGPYLVVALSCIPSVAFAAGLVSIVPCGGQGQTACTVCDLAKLAQNILNDAIYLSVFVAAILFAWAGFRLLTSVANPGERSRAKDIFVNVAIGLIIILIGWLVIDVLMRALLGQPLAPWNVICNG